MTLVVKQPGCDPTKMEFKFDEMTLNQKRVHGGMRVELTGKVNDPFTPFKAVTG